MEELAALGGLMLSNCAGAATPVILEPVYDLNAGSPPPYTAAEVSATDAVFHAQAAATQEDPPPLPVAAMVVSAGIVNLKAIVVDQARPEREEEDEAEKPAAKEVPT